MGIVLEKADDYDKFGGGRWEKFVGVMGSRLGDGLMTIYWGLLEMRQKRSFNRILFITLFKLLIKNKLNPIKIGQHHCNKNWNFYSLSNKKKEF